MLILLFIFTLLLAIVYALGLGISRGQVANDAALAEKMTNAKKELGERVSVDKTIPDSVAQQNGVSYTRVDNQTAEICATFSLPRSGENDTFISPMDLIRGYLGAQATKHSVYRDNVTFTKHNAGRNCYAINYAPINVGYEGNGSGNVCDLKRPLNYRRYTGQKIKGFIIGGPLTTNPGGTDVQFVMARDVDAFDSSCKKIPVSALKVGDSVELYPEPGPNDGKNQIQFVKAIKKEY